MSMSGNFTQMRRGSRLLSSCRGFTFIEMIVSLALMAILIAIFGMGLVAAMQSYDFSRGNVEVIQKGQMAMARIIRELTELTAIRGINPDRHFIIYDRIIQTSDGPSRPVTFCLQYQSGDRRIILYSDVPAGTSDPSGLEGNLLTDGVGNLSFQFFQGDEAWEFPADISLLSTIEIRLELIRPDAPGRYHPFKTLVHLRNVDSRGGARGFETGL